MNQITLIGRVGQAPEKKTFDNGGEIVTFSIATSEKWTDKATGEKKEKTDWHTCKASGPLAGVIEKYVAKGDLFGVIGKQRHRKWEDKDGNARYSAEVDVQSIEFFPKGKGSDSQQDQPEESGLPF